MPSFTVWDARQLPRDGSRRQRYDGKPAWAPTITEGEIVRRDFSRERDLIRQGKACVTLIGVMLYVVFFCKLGTGAEPLKPLRGRALRPGDTILVVAPARTPDEARISRAKARLVELGFNVVIPTNLFRKNGYLAGTDQQRADELMSAFADKDIDAIFAATGGFGTTRLLDLLDYDVIRKNPKVFIGYSDITGLHTAINEKTGLITFHGPNLDSGSGPDTRLHQFSSHWRMRAILQASYASGGDGYVLKPFGFPMGDGIEFTAADFETTCNLDPPVVIHAGRATGKLVGGNLSLITALMGTPYEVQTRGNILFLEDIGEAPYRVDRMLSTLKLAGKLKEVSGVVLGTFTDRDDQDRSLPGQSVNEVLESYFKGLGVPVINGFPAGHHACNATLPIGAQCRIDSESSSLMLIEPPVLLEN